MYLVSTAPPAPAPAAPSSASNFFSNSCAGQKEEGYHKSNEQQQRTKQSTEREGGRVTHPWVVRRVKQNDFGVEACVDGGDRFLQFVLLLIGFEVLNDAQTAALHKALARRRVVGQHFAELNHHITQDFVRRILHHPITPSPPPVTSHHITSHHIPSHHITSHHITSQHSTNQLMTNTRRRRHSTTYLEQRFERWCVVALLQHQLQRRLRLLLQIGAAVIALIHLFV